MGGKEILQVKGEIPCAWCLQLHKACLEIIALQLPTLPEDPHTPAGRDLDTQSWGIQATHTHSKQYTHSCRGKCQPGEFQRERKGFYLHLGGAEEVDHGQQWLWETLGFSERWCVWKAGQWLSAAVGVPGETFWKWNRGVLGRDAVASALPARVKDFGHGLLPPSAAGQRDQKGAQQGDF